MNSTFLLALSITASVFALLLLPGFVLSFVLYPKRGILGGPERAALSIGLSIVILVLTGYTLNLTPWRVQFGSVLTAISIIVIGGLACAGMWHRESYQGLLTEMRRYLSPQNILALGLIVGVVFALSWLAAAPPGAGPTTEFFVVDHKIQEGYLMLDLGIINHEPDHTAYTLRIQAGDKLLDATPSVLLASGERWETTLTTQLADTGSYEPLRLRVLLVEDGNTDPCRGLHLWLENGTLR
jgi:uncharacterized membrane protein